MYKMGDYKQKEEDREYYSEGWCEDLRFFLRQESFCEYVLFFQITQFLVVRDEKESRF